MTKSPHFFSKFFSGIFSHTHTMYTTNNVQDIFKHIPAHSLCTPGCAILLCTNIFVFSLLLGNGAGGSMHRQCKSFFFNPLHINHDSVNTHNCVFFSTCTTFHQLASQYHWSIADMIVLVSTKWQISIIPCCSSSSSSWVVLMSFVSNFFITPRKCSYAHDQITTFFSQIFDFLVEFSEKFCWCTMTFKAQVNAF